MDSCILRLPVDIDYAFLATFENLQIDVEEGEYDLWMKCDTARGHFYLSVVADLEEFPSKIAFFESARAVLGRIAELDFDAYERTQARDDTRYTLRIVGLAKSELVLRYFGANVNSDWSIAYVLDESGGWKFCEYR